jgi:hypothetical protein
MQLAGSDDAFSGWNRCRLLLVQTYAITSG